MIILGLIIGKAQTRIHGFCADIKLFQINGSSHKRKNHAGSVHIKILNGVVLDAFVQILQVINRSSLADYCELGSIHSVPVAHAMGLSLDHPRKVLQHTVSEGIAVNFIQAREIIDAQNHNLQALAAPTCRL